MLFMNTAETVNSKMLPLPKGTSQLDYGRAKEEIPWYILSIDHLYLYDFHLYKLIRSFTNISPLVNSILLLFKNPSND